MLHELLITLAKSGLGGGRPRRSVLAHLNRDPMDFHLQCLLSARQHFSHFGCSLN